MPMLRETDDSWDGLSHGDPFGDASRQARDSLKLLFAAIKRKEPGIPNANYVAGRRMEYDRMEHYRQLGQTVMRTAGSHGLFDIISVDAGRAIVTLVQCKVVASVSAATRLLRKFREAPPLTPMPNIHQRLEIKVKGSTEIHSVTI